MIQRQFLTNNSSRFILLLIFILLALVALEFMLRLAGWTSLKLRSGADYPNPQAFRLLHIGESTTFGLGVHPTEAYPAVLERMLQIRYPNRHFQSFNRGIPGIVTTSMLKTLPDKLVSLRPDVVIISAGANDYNERLNRLESTDESWLPKPLIEALHDLRLYKITRLTLDLINPYTKIENGEVIFFHFGGSENILYEVPLNKGKIEKVTAQLETNLGQMIELSRQTGARVLLVGYLRSYEENSVLKRMAQRHGITFVNCFVESNKDYPGFFVADGWHPSPAGHRHIADAILPFIEL